ncbi:hypothetical protein PR002_g3599 [Phytophthora rubi]|uniref:Uncharacterized protein n=1 Tax=Phytophthora rubi TaxID=129364 RepID=A0A6A3NRB2_9STRA|nr:hypothetical protein PR002_g3599 [Phytophthora rubi]
MWLWWLYEVWGRRCSRRERSKTTPSAHFATVEGNHRALFKIAGDLFIQKSSKAQNKAQAAKLRVCRRIDGKKE